MKREKDKTPSSGPKSQLPQPLEASFWVALSEMGGEEAAIAAGNLSFQITIERHTSDGYHFRMKMTPPVLENSRRFLRMVNTERLIRAKVDQDLLYSLQDPIIYIDDQGADSYMLRKRNAAKNFLSYFKKTFYKPIHLLGQYSCTRFRHLPC